jgi:hypothetical protein
LHVARRGLRGNKELFRQHIFASGDTRPMRIERI